jgi:hypothetical protein
MTGFGLPRTWPRAAILLMLAACAETPPATPPQDPIFWNVRRAASSIPSCVSELHTPTQTQQFIERADGISLYVIVARDGRTVAQIPGGEALPPEGAPFLRPLPEGTRMVGTVLQSRPDRYAVQVKDSATLRTMLEQAQDSTVGAASAQSLRPITQHRRCMVTINPPGTGRS